MKPLEQLDNAYKKALHDFESTPSDKQWQRLALALNRGKNMRRRYLFILSCFLLFGIATAGLLMFNSSNSRKTFGEIHVAADQQKQITVKPLFQQKNRPNIHVQNDIINQSNKIFTQPKINRELGSVQNVEIRKNYKFNDQAAKNASSINNQNEVAGQTITPFDFIDFKAFGISIKEGVRESVPSTLLLAISINAASQKGSSKTKKPNITDKSGLFLTLSGGYGEFDNKILQIENAAKQHKDVQQIFNSLNGNYKAKQLQAGITYVPKKAPGLSLTGGLQYRELSHRFNLNYRLTEIPLTDAEGNILGYKKDTGSIMEFNLAGINSLKFISLPAYLKTPLWSNKNNEFFVGAGMQFQVIMGTGGEYLDINNLKVSKTKPTSFRPWNLGYTIGGGYSRCIGKNLSVCAEIQRITNIQIQKFEPGDIKSRMTGINTQIGIKYKIK